MNTNKIALEKIEIPFMSDNEIANYYKTIKPIKRFNSIPFYLRELTDKELTEICYTWIEKDSKFTEVDINQLSVLKELNILHKYCIYGIFKPSVGEVISQIPKELLNQVVAFEIIKHSGNVTDFGLYCEEFNDDFQVSTVRLYSKKIL